jgi:hypothetical protein
VPISSSVLSLVGFAVGLAGVCVLWGFGWALLVAGVLLFVVGGIDSARDQSPRRGL